MSVLIALVVLAAELAWRARAAEPSDTRVLAGTVVDRATDRPLPNVVFLVYASDPATGRRTTVPGETGAAGAFEITVPRGTEVMIAWNMSKTKGLLLDLEELRDSDDYPARIEAGAEDVRALRLSIPVIPSRQLQARVVDGDGNGVAGASVQVYVRTPAAITDEQGVAVLPLVPADRDVLLYASMDADKKAGAVTVTKEDEVASIALAPRETVEGRLMADDDKPAADLKFWCYPVLNGQPLPSVRRSMVTTDVEGRFKVEDGCPGLSYMLYWYGNSSMNSAYKDGRQTAVFVPGEPIELQVCRFVDNWDAPGNIGVHDETRCGKLENFCLDRNDNILACDSKGKRIRVIAPDDKLIADWELKFPPQAIECRDDGSVVVSGGGKIAVLNAEGGVVAVADAPGDVTTGIGWSGKDVFACVRHKTSYSIFRMNEALAEQTMIISGLRGCCGQMDFTAKDGVIYVAANCEFKVVKYDREGNQLTASGNRARRGREGWDGCCEPKNVCFDSEGYLYTSESGNCGVKKFSADGQALGSVCTVEGIRGCVRVSIALPRDRSKVYMLDTGRNIIRTVTPAETVARAD